jgi:flagellar hook-associated protein 2
MSTKPVTVDLSALGIGAGYDSGSVVTQLVALRKRPITALQTTQTNVKAAASALAVFSSKLADLKAASQALADPTHYAPYAATSSSSGVVASADSSAVAGLYSVQVAQLAQAQRTVSHAQPSSTAPLGQSGTLSLTINGTRSDISVTPDQSLATLAGALSKAARVSTAVVYDGTSYRLQVRALDTGAANAITFSEADGADLGFGADGNTSQVAQDAVATVDGLKVTSATNQVSGAIGGIKLAFAAVTSAPATLTVQPDSSSLATQIGAFTAAYNAVVANAHASAGYGSTAASNPALQGDHAMHAALSTLKKLMAASVPGATGAYTTLGSVGLRLADDATVSLDATKLAAALQADPTSVRRLFVTDHATGATGIMKSFASAVDSLSTSFGAPIAAEVSRLKAQATALDRSISSAQRRVTAYQSHLEAQFNGASSSITANRTLYRQVGGTGKFI